MRRRKRFRPSTYLLAGLIFIDVVLILLHTLHRLTVRGIIRSDLFANPILSMSVPGMLPDIFQYGQELAVVVLLLFAFYRRGRAAYVIWAVAFGYILVDDVFELHERAGYWLEARLGLHNLGALPGSEEGQMLFLAAIGLLLFTVSLLLIWKSGAEVRRVSIDLSMLLLVAAFFGVGVDFVQGFVMDIRGISGLVKIVEDGGEMVIMAIVAWYSYRLAFEEIPDFGLSQLVRRRPSGRTEPQELSHF